MLFFFHSYHLKCYCFQTCVKQTVILTFVIYLLILTELKVKIKNVKIYLKWNKNKHKLKIIKNLDSFMQYFSSKQLPVQSCKKYIGTVCKWHCSNVPFANFYKRCLLCISTSIFSKQYSNKNAIQLQRIVIYIICIYIICIYIICIYIYIYIYI